MKECLWSIAPADKFLVRRSGNLIGSGVLSKPDAVPSQRPITRQTSPTGDQIGPRDSRRTSALHVG